MFTSSIASRASGLGSSASPKFAVSKLSAAGNDEISGNTSGSVANKGMEGLAITPDGKTLVGVMQSPLLQDGGTGHRSEYPAGPDRHSHGRPE